MSKKHIKESAAKAEQTTTVVALHPSGEQKVAVAKSLRTVLASTHAMALQARSYHWNVTGARFIPLHDFFGTQYEALQEAEDEVAERIRALGQPCFVNLKEFARLASIREDEQLPTSANDMLERYAENLERLTNDARACMLMAQEAHDEVTADMMIGRMHAQEKALWMVRAMLA
jgi:starvation-inducible DNA-binding protein